MKNSKKLHLGCGQVYLEGYTNIDYPLSEHTVQPKSVADEFGEITKLRYKAGSIEEVRLHHVFEHFTRPVALALIASWHSWLEADGRIHIEVPDFDATVLRVLNPLTSDRNRKVGLRHIFGSNEAPWATHYEGWSKARLVETLELFGFTIVETKKTSYLATHNITVIARKTEKTPTLTEFKKRAKQYLYNFTVDDSEFETKLLGIWLGHFNEQAQQTFAKT